MQVPKSHMRIGRVLHEDDAFMTLEVPKDDDRPLRIEDGDRYLTFIFTHNTDDGIETWIPWEES